MSRKFTLVKDYYEEGFDIYKKKTITIKPEVTVLVGCNGIGKTTLLRQIKDNLMKNNIPYIFFDNLKDGGGYAVSEAGFYGDFGFMATAIQSSEGENIVLNMGNLAARIGEFVRNGIDPKEKKRIQLERDLAKLRGEEIEGVSEILKERWILLDAIDSGLSVDNIVDIKE